MADVGVGWADLPADLVANILKRLDVADFVRALAVCTPWRYVPARTTSCRPCKPQLPWLLLAAGSDNPASLCFYDLGVRKYYDLGLHGLARRRCIGSSQGFLITASHKDVTDIDATNPLTGARLPLPVAIPDLLPLISDMVRDANVRSMLLSGRTTEHKIREHIENREVEFGYLKAVISPSLDIAAAIVEYTSCSLKFRRVLLGRTTDASWTNLALTLTSPFQLDGIDILFHGDRLYVINQDGTLAVVDYHDLSAPPLLVEYGCPDDMQQGHLVQSPDKNDLLLLIPGHVNPFKEMTLTSSDESDGEEEEEEEEDSDERFRAYKLDERKQEFDRIWDMGDVAVFIAGTRSVSSVCTRRWPEVRKNCVYYSETRGGRELWRVFSLEDGSIREWAELGDLLLGSPPPIIWFAPAINRVKLSLW